MEMHNFDQRNRDEAASFFILEKYVSSLSQSVSNLGQF